MRNFGQSGLPDGGRKGFFVCLLLALVVESVGSRGEAAGVSALTAQVVSAAFGVNEAQRRQFVFCRIVWTSWRI